MSNYIPHYTKRKRIFAGREQELRRSIARRESFEKMARIAKKVRESKYRVLRAERARLVPASEYYDTKRAAKLDAETKRWMAMSVGDIIAMYQEKMQAGD